jgi:hypothetical protein
VAQHIRDLGDDRSNHADPLPTKLQDTKRLSEYFDDLDENCLHIIVGVPQKGAQEAPDCY